MVDISVQVIDDKVSLAAFGADDNDVNLIGVLDFDETVKLALALAKAVNQMIDSGHGNI